MSVPAYTRKPSRTQVDWGLGRYEHTAQQLRPAARVLVNHANVTRDERVVDVGCGTGNAALIAAGRGARVKGVDPAMRLLKVARGRAAARGLDVTFVHGEAASLPLADASADVVLSNFGVIFASDAVAAADELARVTAPGGRIVLTAWLPVGAIHEIGRAAMAAIGEVVGTPSRAASVRMAQPAGARRPVRAGRVQGDPAGGAARDHGPVAARVPRP